MTQKKSVEVVVGQQRLSLRTDRDPEHVQSVAETVNERLGEILPFGQPISHQVLLLLAMTLAEDMMAAQGELGTLKGEVRQRSRALLAQLEREFPV